MVIHPCCFSDTKVQTNLQSV